MSYGIRRASSGVIDMVRHLLAFALGVLFTAFVGIAQTGPIIGPPPSTMTTPVQIEPSLIAPKGRLPDGVRPKAYRVGFRIDPRQARFSGQLEVDIEFDSARAGFWLHGTGLDVQSVDLQTHTGINIGLSWQPSDVEGVNFLGAKSQIIPQGQHTLRVSYTAPFDQNLSGLFSLSEGNGPFALAKSESIQARKFLPSFDEPAFKTPFAISIDTPADLIAVSNGRLVSEHALDDGWKRHNFHQTSPLPTYLLSVTVGNFEKLDFAPIPPNTIRNRPVPLAGYAQKGKAQNLRFALSHTADLVAYYEGIFGLPYPYEKLDIIAAPAWPSGATELAGAITYRESRILLPENAGAEARRALLRLHTHELTHMWFGNLVTPDWWEDLWLKEAFATWGTPIALESIFPNQRHMTDAVVSALSAMALDSLSTTRAIREPILDTKNVRSAYDAITYRKGMAVIAMVDAYFGADVFRPAMGQFLAARTNGVTNSRDFFEFLRQELGQKDMARVFQAYVVKPGMPVVRIERHCTAAGKTTLGLRQKRYSPLAQSVSGDDIWPIPMCFKGSKRGRSCTIFDTATTEFETDISCEAPIFPNIDGLGYYRFQLVDSDWETLIADFASLSTDEAIVALDNGMTQFEDGHMSATTLKALLEASLEYPQWQVFTYPLDRLETWVAFASTDQKATYLHGLNGKYLPLLLSLTDTNPSADRDAAMGTLTAFLVNVTHDPTMTEAITQATKAFLGVDVEVTPNALRPSDYNSAFVNALRHDPTLFAAMFDKMQTAPDTQVRLALASAIGQAAPNGAVQTLLTALTDGDTNLRETYYILQGLMKNPSHSKAIWPWFDANFETLSTRIPSQWQGRLPRLAVHFCAKSDANRLKTLFDTKGAFAPGHGKALAQTIERIENCDKRKRTIGPKLTMFDMNLPPKTNE